MELTHISQRSESEAVRVEAAPGRVDVVLSRPARQNAIDAAMLAGLHAALDEAERSPDCRVVVLRGTGGTFCTGMDFADATAAVDADPDAARRGGESFMALLDRVTTLPRAVVATVDGRVTGGGVGIAAASDFVVATPRSVFSLPEALWGLVPCCVLPFLIRRTGFQAAHAMTVSTLPVTAEEGHRTGLVDDVADEPEFFVRRLGGRLAKVEPSSIGEAKRYSRRLWFHTEETGRLAVEEFARLMSSAPVRRRIAAFAAGGVPPWESR